MASRISTSFALRFYIFCVTSFLLTSPAVAHMNLLQPIPRTHEKNPFTTDQTVDYDIMAPLDGAQKPFACGGTKRGPSVLTVKAGEVMNVEIEGDAPHDGGHCEFSISYDGTTFVSLKTIIRECLRSTGNTFSIPLPSTTPGGSAVFSWTWVNAEGNREFYQNCADITIDGATSGTLDGPPIVVANLPGYPTIPEMLEGVDDKRSLYMNRRSISISPTTSEVQANTVNTQQPTETARITTNDSSSNSDDTSSLNESDGRGCMSSDLCTDEADCNKRRRSRKRQNSKSNRRHRRRSSEKSIKEEEEE